MLFVSLIAASHAADPLPIVALGGSVAMRASSPAQVPPEPAPAPLPGGWLPALADCLEERAPQRFTVVDRASLGANAPQIRASIAEIKAIGAVWAVVTLSPSEGELKASRNEIEGLLGDLSVEHIVLVGLVPVPVEGADPGARDALDERAGKWNKLLGDLAAKSPAAVHVDPWSSWPKEAAARSALSTLAGALSDQGHARVAAAVCDAILPPKPRDPG